jgi:hypothetical protein
MKRRKRAVMPAKADPEQQEAFLNPRLDPGLDEEQPGKRRVFLVDAARCVRAFLRGAGV